MEGVEQGWGWWWVGWGTHLETLQQNREDRPVHQAVCPRWLAVHNVQEKLHGLYSCLHSSQAFLDLLYQHLEREQGRN